MDTLTSGLLIVGGSTIVSLSGMFLVRKHISRQTLEACHEVGGIILAIVGTLYAILVGLIVVNSQAKVDAASDMAVTEAGVLSHVYHMAETFTQPARWHVRKDIHDYAVAVIDQDWTKVEEGQEQEATVPPYRHLWATVMAYVPKESNDQECYSQILDNMQQLSDARRYRMVEARGGLSPVLWWVLISGGVMIVLFTYFFFVESMTAQILMTAGVAIFLSMNVYLIYICQNPYRPELGAKDAGFGTGFDTNWFNVPPQPPEK